LPEKNWKFSPNDAKERAYWEDYQKAFSDMLSNTSTEWAPWYVIPADRKWFARICASAIMAQTLMRINPQYPTVGPVQHEELLEARAELEAQAPAGAEPDPFKAELRAKAAKRQTRSEQRAGGNGAVNEMPGADSTQTVTAGSPPK
jgi:hypothetical protein